MRDWGETYLGINSSLNFCCSGLIGKGTARADWPLNGVVDAMFNLDIILKAVTTLLYAAKATSSCSKILCFGELFRRLLSFYAAFRDDLNTNLSLGEQLQL